MNRLFLVIILLISAFLRFFNLMHDSPYFFNPDERNMANAISQFRLPSDLSQVPICLISQISPILTHNPQPTTHNCNLNPHFFAYGQFPLYLAFASDQVVKIPMSLVSPISQIQPTANNQQLTTSFSSSIFWLRFYSALASVLTVLMVYLITKSLFGNWKLEIGHYAAILAAFSPGLIQSAHFGTTESLLTFFFLASIYLSLRYLSNLSRLKFVFLNSFVIGLALGSKLTGIFFFIPPVITLIIQIIGLIKKKKRNLFIGILEYWSIGVLILIGSILIFIISSPYNLVEPESFKSAVFGYEQDVATGRYEAFYTRQFVNTTPILFQGEKIFPYALGWPVFILGSIGFLLMLIYQIFNIIPSITKSIKYQVFSIKGKKSKPDIHTTYYILLTTSFLIYLIPNASLFAKWTRFMTPVFPFFAMFAGYTVFLIYQLIIKKFKHSLVLIGIIGVLVFISLLPGIAFMSIYTHEDTRVTASKWIYPNIPNGSYILSETANVVDIPLGLPNNLNTATKNYEVISFDFYHLDENPTLFRDLLMHLEKANYIFIPSRRIFANYTKLPQIYPLVTKYYQLLNSRALGFEKINEINSFPKLEIGNWKLEIDDEHSEETYTVFDHPVIRIYRKIKPMTTDEYRSLFSQ